MNWWEKVKAFPKTVREFLSEVRTEIGKTYFPGREEVMATTIVVIVTSVIFSVFLFVADQAIVAALKGLFGLAS
jgi:preprotein translocase subunit SecE